MSYLYGVNVMPWCRDCHKIIDHVHNFLKLDLKHAQAGGTPVFDLPQNVACSLASEGADLSPVADDASSVTSSEESFERVSTADLAEYDATASETKTSASDPPPVQTDDECATLDPAAVDDETSPSNDVPCQ